MTSSEGLFPSLHEGGAKAIVINNANCCNSFSEAVILARVFHEQCKLILTIMYRLDASGWCSPLNLFTKEICIPVTICMLG